LLRQDDEFYAFLDFYSYTLRDKYPTWHRRCESCSQRHYVHILAEQATVQWALEQPPSLWELAANVIRVQRNACHEHPQALPRLLRQQAANDSDERSFVQRVSLAMERSSTEEAAAAASSPRKRPRVSND